MFVAAAHADAVAEADAERCCVCSIPARLYGVLMYVAAADWMGGRAKDFAASASPASSLHTTAQNIQNQAKTSHAAQIAVILKLVYMRYNIHTAF